MGTVGVVLVQGYGAGVRWVRRRGAHGCMGAVVPVGAVGTMGKWARWTVGAVEGGYRRMRMVEKYKAEGGGRYLGTCGNRIGDFLILCVEPCALSKG